MSKDSINVNKEILKTIKYFSFFAYHPTLDEIHTFLTVKIDKKKLKNELNKIKYTPPEYSIKEKSNIKYQISKRKLNNWRYKIYIKLLTYIPQVKLIGLSGSIAMMNADLADDIDLFIITEENRLFTGRFLATILSIITGLKRRRDQSKAPNKVCLNLFFDETNLTVPDDKKTEFVAHEILQMKPLINKDKAYERFLEANRWVRVIFPNSSRTILNIEDQKSKTRLKFKSSGFELGFDFFALIFKLPANLFEKFIKKLQLILINRHITTEIITDSQLWFHPKDFGNKFRH